MKIPDEHRGDEADVRAWPGAAILAVPPLMMAVTGLVMAWRTPLWRDEVASLSFATLTLPRLVDGVSHVDAVMAPYYVVAFTTQRILPGDLGLRLPSVLAAVGSTIIVTSLARRWWGSVPGLVGGLAFALNTLAVTMSTTARPYALSTFMVALAVFALDRAVTDGRRLHWIAYAVALGAAGVLHLFALTTIPALAVLASASRRRFKTWMVATVGALLLAIPVAAASFSQRSQVAWIPRPELRNAIGSLASAIDYRADGALSSVNFAALTALTVVAGAILLRLRARDLGDFRVNCFAILLFGAPWVVLLVASLLAEPYLRTTYLAPATLGFALLIASGAARGLGLLSAGSWSRAWGAMFLVLCALPMVVAAQGTAQVVTQPWHIDDFPGLAARLQEVAEVGDVLVVAQPYNELGVAAGLARQTGDTAYLSQLQAQLPEGAQPLVGIRTVNSVDPFVTSDQDNSGGTTWVVYTRNVLDDESYSRLAQSRLGCPGRAALTETKEFGILRLSRGTCYRAEDG